MRSIPPAIADDAEDVVWALETAEALWNRRERVDAVVWLRRAAQAAGDAEHDDRALELARHAAELTEWMARNPAEPTPSRPATADTAETSEDVDDLLREPSEDVAEMGEDVSELEEDPSEEGALEEARTRGDASADTGPRAGAPEAVADEEPTPVQPRAVPATPRPPASPLPPPEAHVPTAAEVHAGMLDPWADAEAPTREQPLPSLPPMPAAPAAPAFDSDEVVTSAPPFSMNEVEANAVPPVPVPSFVPPTPIHAPASPPVVTAVGTPRAAPPPRPGAPRPPAAPTRPRTPAHAPAPAPAPAHAPAPSQAVAPEPSPAPSSNGVDLSAVEALSDLPDDARVAFANAATVTTLAREDEVAGFALALVLDGGVDLTATIVDAPAERLRAGAVLRSRGTIDTIAAVRLVGAEESSRVATWDEDAVTEAFRTCPWVEDELRALGDRLQALVGITMGPLGDRLDPSLRADVTSRLRVRALAEHEIIATRGAPVPGLVVVGAGMLELVDIDGNPTGTFVRAGEFLFPTETLRAATAPSTVRASRGGTIVLFAERGVAQEILVTCPPLLEIFAGM